MSEVTVLPNKRLATAFAVVLVIEAALVAAVFFFYGRSWEDASLFIGLLLLPPIFLTRTAWRRVRLVPLDKSRAPSLLGIAWCLGVGGMLMALAEGPHAAATFLLTAAPTGPSTDEGAFATPD